MAHTEDWLELAQELNAVRSAATPDLWDRFAKAIDHIHEQIDEQADYETRTFRPVEMVTVSATSRCQ